MLRRTVCLVLMLFATRLSFAADVEFALSADEQAICDLTNAERKDAGLEPLRPNAKLFEAARKHSANMAKQNKLTHKLDGKNVAERAEDAGYKYSHVGENVAWNQKTPADVVAGWMNSSGHRANILRKEFTEIGVGIARNDKNEPYYTQTFGRPVVVQPGGRADGKVVFTLTNKTSKTAKITLPLTALFTSLDPHETGRFTATLAEGGVPVKVRVGKATFELVIDRDTGYSIELSDGTYTISKETPVELAP